MTSESSPSLKTASCASALGRRRAIQLLAVGAAGLWLGGEKSYAFMDFLAPSPASLKKFDIPEDWMADLGPQLPSYAGFLQKLNLRNVSVRQLIEPHTHIRDGIHNTLPPPALWGNIRSTLRVIDSLSDRLDLRVANVISVYRSPSYNAHCPGAKSSSYHKINNAIDVVFKCPPGKVAAMARAMRSSNIFHGGVGHYPTFTHIDTRGHNADWNGD